MSYYIIIIIKYLIIVISYLLYSKDMTKKWHHDLKFLKNIVLTLYIGYISKYIIFTTYKQYLQNIQNILYYVINTNYLLYDCFIVTKFGVK